MQAATIPTSYPSSLYPYFGPGRAGQVLPPYPLPAWFTQQSSAQLGDDATPAPMPGSAGPSPAARWGVVGAVVVGGAALIALAAFLSPESRARRHRR